MNIVKITDFMSDDLICLDLKANSKDEALRELSEILGRSENINDEKKCYDALVEREKLGSTGIGKGVAIPHAKTEYAENLTIAFGISRDGVAFDALDDEDVNIFFIFASPLKDSKTYLKILARISRLIRNENFRNKLLTAKDKVEVVQIINEEEQ
jgi:fructose-specific phosphotransferase system IIA component